MILTFREREREERQEFWPRIIKRHAKIEGKFVNIIISKHNKGEERKRDRH